MAMVMVEAKAKCGLFINLNEMNLRILEDESHNYLF